jgi:FAD/FMN-containing dehydrogenase
MTTDITTASPAEPLRGLLDGAVHLPGDAGYDAARLPWNVAVDQRPAAVAEPRNADEVSTIVRRAAECGLGVAPQSTGHNAGPLAARGLEETVLLRTSAMNAVVADPDRGIVRAGGGALWESAVDAAARHGQAVLHGTSPDVGIAGYSLGGGIGWYARDLGLASNSITAVEVIIGDGSLVRATAEQDPELFWALRGGGGSFGVVTVLEFTMYPLTSAYAGFLLWELAGIEPVLREWAAWAPTAPDEVTTTFRAMRFPPMPELPEFLRGRQVAIIDGAVLDNDDRAGELLAGLRAHRPVMDTFARVPAPSLVRLHMDPEGAAPAVSDSAMLSGLPDAAVDAFLETAGPDATTTVLAAELRQLGGALARPAEGGGVLNRLDGEFASFAVAIAATPELGAQGHADAVRLTDALRPFGTGQELLNFAENPIDAARAYPTERWTRLQRVRGEVDPQGVFAANHEVPLPGEGA